MLGWNMTATQQNGGQRQRKEWIANMSVSGPHIVKVKYKEKMHKSICTKSIVALRRADILGFWFCNKWIVS
jgi:hypothetical protein